MLIKKSLNSLRLGQLSIILVSFLVTACGGGGGGSSSPAPGSENPAPQAPAPEPEPQEPEPPAPQGEFGAVQVERFTTAEAPLTNTRDCDNVATDTSAAFTDISQTAGLCYSGSISTSDSSPARVAGGVAVGDYDADGRLDVYVSSGRSTPSRLFRLQADNSFRDTTTPAGVISSVAGRGAAFMDIDLDGWPDLLSLGEAPSFLKVFGNNGNGTFSDITDSTGMNFTKGAFSAAAGDYDLDGDLDLFFAHWDFGVQQNRLEFLWQNQGDSTFVDISGTVEIGRGTDISGGAPQDDFQELSFTPLFANINNDRYPDLVVASDFTTSQVLANTSGTSFLDVTDTDVITDKSGMGSTVADYDNDGDLDWFVSAALFPGVFSLDGNRLYQNDGTGTFVDVTNAAGVRQGYWGWGTCFADFNNDGHLDLVVVNGYDGLTEAEKASGRNERFYDDPALLYINNGNGTFTDRAAELGFTHTAQGRGLACYDYDRDGDLDMLIANSGLAPTLFRNNSFAEGNNYLNIRLKGRENNPQAVGARIEITVDDEVRIAELQLGSNYLSQNPVEAHFGLGDVDTVDTVRIVWPGDEAQETELFNVGANQFLLVHQPDS